MLRTDRPTQRRIHSVLSRRGRTAFGSLLVLVLSVVGLGGPVPIAASARPNIILILTDDQRWDELAFMPFVRSELVNKGITLSNAFVVNPTCCPSRASILTGRYSHSTDVYRNKPPHGGYLTFKPQDTSTIATWLHGAGYQTALVGKYLNGYSPAQASYVPPGWSVWRALALSSRGEGTGGYYNYDTSNNGTLAWHGSAASDYSTDVFRNYAVDFIRSVPATQPLFLYFAPRAPHASATPPARYARALSGVPPIRPPSLNESDMSDKPAWAQTLPLLTSAQLAGQDHFRKKQLRSLLAVDDAVQAIVGALSASGRLANTLIDFTSDNGLLAGEHRWTAKWVPWEESTRVPMVVRFDAAGWGTPRTESRMVLNIDLAPTFAAAAGVLAPGAEGRSLLPLLNRGATTWRTRFLIEHMYDSTKYEVPTYCGIRTTRYLYVAYSGGQEELYDLKLDPYELKSKAADPAYLEIKSQLRHRLIGDCVPTPPGFSFSNRLPR
jgi:arylsulfatase A-like enzyme